MQHIINQTEITEAIKQYITSQGLNLEGKKVTISFTNGRKETGLSADIRVEEHLQSFKPMVDPALACTGENTTGIEQAGTPSPPPEAGPAATESLFTK